MYVLFYGQLKISANGILLKASHRGSADNHDQFTTKCLSYFSECWQEARMARSNEREYKEEIILRLCSFSECWIKEGECQQATKRSWRR